MAVQPSASRPFSLNPTTSGSSIEMGWPSMHASASMPPTPQPTTPRPLIMVVCESVPTSVSGYSQHGRLFAIGKNHRREIFEIHLVHDAGVGRHHAKILKRFLAPAQKRIALLIALEFEQRVNAERARRAELVHLHRVIDHQVGGNERIGALGIGAHCAQRIAHGRQIDHARNAGEILQQHAGRAEVDFLRWRADFPFRDVLDIGRLDGRAVFGAQQIFEQNLDGIGNAGDVRAALFQGFERVVAVLAASDG